MRYFWKSMHIDNNELSPGEVKQVWASVYPDLEGYEMVVRYDGIHFVPRVQAIVEDELRKNISINFDNILQGKNLEDYDI